jgi:hypothetical protein
MHELQVRDDDRDASSDTILLVGGIALMVVGAGLVLSNRSVRKYIGQVGVTDLVLTAFPDLERYLRMRSM